MIDPSAGSADMTPQAFGGAHGEVLGIVHPERNIVFVAVVGGGMRPQPFFRRAVAGFARHAVGDELRRRADRVAAQAGCGFRGVADAGDLRHALRPLIRQNAVGLRMLIADRPDGILIAENTALTQRCRRGGPMAVRRRAAARADIARRLSARGKRPEQPRQDHPTRLLKGRTRRPAMSEHDCSTFYSFQATPGPIPRFGVGDISVEDRASVPDVAHAFSVPCRHSWRHVLPATPATNTSRTMEPTRSLGGTSCRELHAAFDLTGSRYLTPPDPFSESGRTSLSPLRLTARRIAPPSGWPCNSCRGGISRWGNAVGRRAARSPSWRSGFPDAS